MTLRAVAIEVPMWWRRAEPEVVDDLVRRLRAGEPEALGAAYDLHHGAVRTFARRLVGDADTAEDLVQEVFVTLAKAARRFDGRSSLRTFIMGIAVRHAQHHVRAAVRRRSAWQRSAEVHREAGKGADALVADKELAAALQRALDQIPVDQRVAFILCEVEERTAVEVAAIVGIPEATVRTRHFHARKKLRQLLQEEGFR